jgi:hypothetical protein
MVLISDTGKRTRSWLILALSLRETPLGTGRRGAVRPMVSGSIRPDGGVGADGTGQGGAGQDGAGQGGVGQVGTDQVGAGQVAVAAPAGGTATPRYPDAEAARARTAAVDTVRSLSLMVDPFWWRAAPTRGLTAVRTLNGDPTAERQMAG